MIHFKVDIKAMGAVRMTRNGKWVNPNAKRYLSYKDSIAAEVNLLMRMNKWDVLKGNVHADITVYSAVPKSYSKKRTAACLENVERPSKKPDIDNIFKGITDALNGICYEDDKQIVSINMSKWYAEKDYIEVKFTEVM